MEEIDAASIALKNEIIHLLQECQLYTLRCLGLDEKLVFDDRLPFEKTGAGNCLTRIFSTAFSSFIHPSSHIIPVFRPIIWKRKKSGNWSE